MDALLAAFGVTFIAELGDKTQVVALGFGARHRVAPVLAGMAVGYGAANLLSVLIGAVAGAALPTRVVGVVGGLLFLGFALWTLLDDDDDASDGEATPAGATTQTSSPVRTVLTVASAIFVAELGDKTMLATTTLAARGAPVLVWVGATLGETASGALGVLVGRWAGDRLPTHAVRIGSALLFAGFGVLLLLDLP